MANNLVYVIKEEIQKTTTTAKLEKKYSALACEIVLLVATCNIICQFQMKKQLGRWYLLYWEALNTETSQPTYLPKHEVVNLSVQISLGDRF